MNSTFFECNISYLNEVEGKQKKVTENIMVDALSFGEAEVVCTDSMGAFDGLVIKGIKRSTYADIILPDGERCDNYYKAKTTVTILDEKSGKEKGTTIYYLVNGDSVAEALMLLQKKVVDVAMDDMTIKGLTDTNIVDVVYNSDTVEGLVEVKLDDVTTTVPKKTLNKAEFALYFGAYQAKFVHTDGQIECVEFDGETALSKYVGLSLEYVKK